MNIINRENNIFNTNLLSNLDTTSPDFFLKFIIRLPSKFRNEKLLRSVSKVINSYKPFCDALYSNNRELLSDFYLTLSRYLEPITFKKMQFIKKAGDIDDAVYIILVGSVMELAITYDTISLRKREYINHLVKLYYLNENELFTQTINMNKSIIPLSYDINQWINDIEEPDEKREFFKLYESAKNEIEECLFNKTKKMEDYVELIKYKNKNRYNKGFNSTGKFNSTFSWREDDEDGIKYSFKPNKNGDENVTFNLILASYKLKNIYKKGDFIGYLSHSTKIKYQNSFFALETTDCALFQKSKKSYSNIIMSKLKALKSDSLGYLYNSFYIFQDLTKEYFEENICQYFNYYRIRKDEFLIEQGNRYNGVFFVLNGEFKVTTKQSFQNLDYLIQNLKDCLKKNFINYVCDTKKASNLTRTIEKRNLQAESMIKKCSRDYYIKMKEVKELDLGTINHMQIIGTEEFYNHITDIYSMSVQCISDYAEVLYLPKENYISVKNKNKVIFERLGKIIETQSNKYILEMQKHKERYLLTYSYLEGKSLKMRKNNSMDNLLTKNDKHCINKNKNKNMTLSMNMSLNMNLNKSVNSNNNFNSSINNGMISFSNSSIFSKSMKNNNSYLSNIRSNSNILNNLSKRNRDKYYYKKLLKNYQYNSYNNIINGNINNNEYYNYDSNKKINHKYSLMKTSSDCFPFSILLNGEETKNKKLSSLTNIQNSKFSDDNKIIISSNNNSNINNNENKTFKKIKLTHIQRNSVKKLLKENKKLNFKFEKISISCNEKGKSDKKNTIC